MARLGLEAICKRSRTSQPHPQHPVFPHLVALLDWATRKLLSWRLSNTMHADFCGEALNAAIAKHGPPQIMKTPLGTFASHKP